MELLYMLIIYCILFVVGTLCMLYRDSAVLCTGPIGTLRQIITESVARVVPSILQNTVIKLCNYLLFKRNCAFQLIYFGLCILAHLVWLVDMIPILYSHYPNYNHTFWPFVAVFTNYFFWHKAWTGDPGEIKESNHEEYMQVYPYDGVIYPGKKECSTCKLAKPARSKHCGICNRCVHKFDHHCIWTNNCVGALNQRHFILFMVSLIVMFLQGIYVGTGCVLDHADDIKLFKASYIDSNDGNIKPMTISVAFQHLFMALPRLVFLIIAIVVLTILVGVFLIHHLYLIWSNQTTNERYKMQELQMKHSEECAYCQGYLASNDTDQSKIYCYNVTSVYRPFSRGFVKNCLEVFFPHHFIRSRIKVS